MCMSGVCVSTVSCTVQKYNTWEKWGNDFLLYAWPTTPQAEAYNISNNFALDLNYIITKLFIIHNVPIQSLFKHASTFFGLFIRVMQHSCPFDTSWPLTLMTTTLFKGMNT